jgi:2,4-dienoyl-CoA reductase-like NADH-dependent reductase (Old Yellow Enzyme family)
MGIMVETEELKTNGLAPETQRGAASKLFNPLNIANGKITLNHRIVMSPMTRNRGVPLLPESTKEKPNRVWLPDELIAKYYAQRATDGGLIVTESILPSAESGSMPGVPGMWLKEHANGWRLVSQFLPQLSGLWLICNRSPKQSMQRRPSYTHN